ncbi:MAG: hypothetical protein OS112_04905 [Methanoregula sp.]|nr:MAG: hypothetical protein OS112_04905 [Methanoregula sp.]
MQEEQEKSMALYDDKSFLKKEMIISFSCWRVPEKMDSLARSVRDIVKPGGLVFGDTGKSPI